MGNNLVGEYLKKARVKGKYSLEQVSNYTKLSKNIIEKIEAGDIHDIPAIYAKGHIKAYANFLKLDKKECLTLFEKEQQEQNGKNLGETEKVESTKVDNTPRFKYIHYLVLMITLLIILIIWSRYHIESELVETPPPPSTENVLEVTDVTTETILEEPIMPEVVVTPEEPQPVEIEPEFVVRPPLFITVESDDDYMYLPDRIKALYTGEDNIVYLTAAVGETWLTYQENDGVIRKAFISQGGSTILKGQIIKMYIGNINGVKIFFNNQLVKAYSKSGVRSLVFPLSVASTVKMPLFIFNNEEGTVRANID